MEHVRKVWRGFLIGCLLAAGTALQAAEPAADIRITPLEIISKLSGRGTFEEPLSVELFTEAALRFSGAEAAELPALSSEIRDLIAAARQELSGVTAPEELGEEILLYLHRHVLIDYRERQTRLDVLVREGSYNCVSSALMYAILAKAFDLGVGGVRTTDHAFCRVLIAEEEVDVETTSPFGFDPGSRREFRDHFGKVTGYTYVPPQNEGDRRLIGEKELLALILYNRSAFASEAGGYARAVPPAVDAYGLLSDAESYERLLVAVSNLASFYGLERRYAEGTRFLRLATARFGPEPGLKRLQADLVHNWAVELIDSADFTGARSVLEQALASSELEETIWRRLMIYAYQKQAREASRRSYSQAARIIREALEQVGRQSELLASFEAYAHNQAAELIRAEDFPAAHRVLLEALQVMPESRVLESDVRKLEAAPERL